MSLMNFYLGRVAYADGMPLQNPKQKHFDFLTKAEGLQANSPSSISKIILPGQTLLLESTSRTIGANLTSTQFELSFVNGDQTRLRWTGTGTSPAFRSLRAVSLGSTPATSTYTAVRLSPTAVQITITGAGVDLSAAQIGDDVYLEASEGTFVSPLNMSSTGQRYTVLSSSASSVVVRDAGNIESETGIALGADYASVLRVFSSTGVQVGDKLRISAPSFNLENRLKDFEVLGVSDRDVIFYNPNTVPETVTSGTAVPVLFFDRLINFLFIESNGPIGLSFDGSPSLVQVSEYCPGSAIFASSLNAISIHATNSTNSDIVVNVQSCSI